MARSKGHQVILGVKKATTWGTAVACAALSGIYAESIETPGDTQLIDNPSLAGVVTMKPSGAGNRQVTVTVKSLLRYEGLETIIALVMGTAGVPATVDTSGRTHSLKLNNQLDGIFATLAYEAIKDTTIIEIPSVKWNKLTVTGKQGDFVRIELSGIGDNYEPASAVNTTTTIDTITLSANEEYALFKHVVVRMNAQGGAGLAAGDNVAVEGFSVTLERQMEPRVTTRRGDKTDEVTDSGFCTVTGQLEFAFFENGTDGNLAFLAEQMAVTQKKLAIIITSPTLAGAATSFYNHTLYLPYVQFEPGKPAITEAGTTKWVAPFQSHAVGTIPTGFPAAYIGALTYEITSKVTTDPLA